MSALAMPVARSASRVEELMGAVEPAFLSLVGWSDERRVVTFPVEHPVMGMPLCRVGDCDCVAYSASGLCRNCESRWRKDGRDVDDFARAARSNRRLPEQDCAVAGCLRPWTTRKAQLCRAHEYQLSKMAGLSLEDFLLLGDVRPLAALGVCAVTACLRQRPGKGSPYCLQHFQQRGRQIREGTFPGDDTFQAVTRAVSKNCEVSLAGLEPLVAAEVLYGLQERVRRGTKVPPWHVRPVCERALAEQVSSLADLDSARLCKRGRRVLTAFTASSRRLGMTPESERRKDVWDAAAFGHSGTIRFTEVRQSWLREALKAAVCDDLPRRRGRKARQQVQNHIGAFSRLSESLHLQREDKGAHLTLLDRQDMVNFSNRLAFLNSIGEISVYTWIAIARMVRKWLEQMRSMGLTQPGQPLHGLPAEFILLSQDIPDEPEDSEAGKDLPDEVMGVLCANLDLLEQRSSREVRVAVELLIDTGRRPFEICSLPYDCLTRDPDGKAVLLYDNHKELRLRRRLPVPEATAALIIGQQARVRARYPDTPVSRLVLLPTVMSNPDGTKPIADIGLQHHDWVAALPDIALSVNVYRDGRPERAEILFDREKIFPYAYRHTYAQRHADAGVPVDVLCQLMDHRDLSTTQRYYNPRELHQTGEKSQVARSRRGLEGLRGRYDLAI